MHELIKALAQAWAGECQARNRYDFYAKTAGKEGYQQIMGVFLETAAHEKTHAKNYFRMIKKVQEKLGETDMSLSVDEVGVPLTWGTTAENLQEAVNGEHHENSEMYPAIAELAKKHGFPEIATQVLAIAEAEKHHEARYQKLLDNLKSESTFKKSKKVWWYCRECGYWHYGEEPPEKCPSCNHPKAYFQVMEEEF